MKIFIDNTVVEFGTSAKTFNGKALKSRSSVDTKSSIVNNPSYFIPTSMATSIKTHNTISSSYINYNNNI